MMYENTDEHISEYEVTINKLREQITELFSKLHFHQALLAEKENQITKLTTENFQLKTHIQNMSKESIPSTYPSQQSYTPPPVDIPKATSTTNLMEDPPSTFTSSEDPRINKRQCPKCGAMGFAIREVDDKSRVISYIPRRIYAKKKVCTKCRYEW
ncbi:MAG: hypothetical protein ACFFCL_15880 [Promethearchaeota archaeon]